MKTKALSYLSKNKTFYAGLIDAVNNENSKILFCNPNGLLIYLKDEYSFIAETKEAAEKMIDAIENPEDSSILVFNDCAKDLIIEKFNFNVYSECHEAVYFSKEPLPVDENADIRKLGDEYTDFVASNYSLFYDPQYIAERIAAETMYGIFIENKIAGFIGIHDHGSLGMLEILPKFRRRGLAGNLLAYMTNLLVKRNELPRSDLIITNEASIHLHKSLNYDVSTESFYWMGCASE